MKKKSGKQAMARGGTALVKYQRLESLGLWRASPEDPKREVIVRMGEATLVFLDSRSEAVLSHWSLPAVRPITSANDASVYAPGEDSDETVEIDDPDMISALKTVRGTSRSAAPREGRLRQGLLGGAAVLALGFVAFVLPGLVKSQTAAALPLAKRAEIGQLALDDLTRLTGSACSGRLGLPALAKLSERIFGPEDTPILYILPNGLERAVYLPGGTILLPKSLIEFDSPEALAGAALTAEVAARADDPMGDILDHAGLLASFELLTSGALPATALKGYGEAMLRQTPHIPPTATLAAAFGKAELRLEPYARWLDPAGETGKALIAADPFQATAPKRLLPDDDWIALQSVCAS